MISQRSATSNIFELDDNKLIDKFVQGSNQLLATPNLRLEVNGGLSQLLARNGDPIAIMYLQNKPRTVIVKHSSPFLELIDRLLIDRDFVMFGDASRAGFIEYKHYVTPAGYRIWHTDPSILWKKWWPTERFQDKQRFNMDILVSFKNNWYPVKNISVNAGTFTIKTIAGQLELKRDDKVLWLAQIMQKHPDFAENIQLEADGSTVDSPVERPLHRTATTRLGAQPSEDLARKIHQKQLEINPDQAWSMIKQLEQKLQSQIILTSEAEAKFIRLENRAIVVERRLQIVSKYLQSKGIDLPALYRADKQKVDN
jgi:hypothetical protein